MALGRGVSDEPARHRGPGERDVVDAAVRAQRGARLVAVAGDDVQRARRKAHPGGELGQAQRREARVLAGLHDAGVAGRERAAHRPPEDLHRVVPRDDVPRHAVRFANRQDGVPRLEGNRVAVQLVARAGVVLEVAGERRGVVAGHSQGLAGVAGLDLREFLVVVADGLAQLHQQPPALGRAEPAPGPVERVAERRARGRHRPVDVGAGPAREHRERLAVAGIDHRDRLAPGGRHPLIADVVTGFHGSSVNAPRGRWTAGTPQRPPAARRPRARWR